MSYAQQLLTIGQSADAELAALQEMLAAGRLALSETEALLGVTAAERDALTAKVAALEARIAELEGGVTPPDEPPVDPPPHDPPPPASYVNARDYAAGNGVMDDTAALMHAAQLAKNENKALYIPDGQYRVSTFSPPEGLRIVGNGDSSAIVGMVRWRGRQAWQALAIGSRSGSAIRPVVGRLTHEGTRFENCRFSGGGGRPTMWIESDDAGTGSQSNDFAFVDCAWERNYSTQLSDLCQDVTVSTYRAGGNLVKNMVFERCHFGAKNADGKSGGMYGGVVFWSSANFTSHPQPEPDRRGYSSIYVQDCVMEATNGWNWDFSGAQYPPTTEWTENVVYVRDSVFKGCGHIDGVDSGAPYHIGLQIEPGFDSVIERNVFGRCIHNAFKIIKGSSRNVFRDNTIDYVTPLPGATPYKASVIVRSEGGVGNVISGNRLLLTPEEFPGVAGQDWIYSDSGTKKSGNTVVRTRSGVIGQIGQA